MSSALSLSEIMTRLLDVNHRAYCEQFHEQSVHQLIYELLVRGWDVNIIGILSCNVISPLVHQMHIFFCVVIQKENSDA